MKKMMIALVLSLFIQSCDSQTKKIDKISKGGTDMESFDLAGLTFKENINDLLELNRVSLADGLTESKTLMGFERFESNTSKFLVFDGLALTGKAAGQKNSVVLHFSEKDSLMKVYELKIYTDKEREKLIGRLKKINAEPGFSKENSEEKGWVFQDENGKPLEGKHLDSYMVWENKTSGICFFLVQTGRTDIKEGLYTELTVLNKKDAQAAEWIRFRHFKFN